MAHPGENPVDVEHRLGEHRGPAGHAGQNAGLQSEHVEVRVDHQVAVVGAETRHGHPVGRHTEGAAVGHQHTLGLPGGARGEEDVREVVRTQSGPALIDLGPSRFGGPVDEGGPGLRADRSLPPGHDDGPQFGQFDLGGPQHGDIVGPEKFGDRDQCRGSGPPEQVGRLPTLEAGVDGHQHGPGHGEAQEGDGPLGAVEGPDGHPVARFDTGHHQGGREGASLLEEFCVGQPGRAVLNGEMRAERLGGRGGYLGDAPPRGAALAHRTLASSMFISLARFPPMILRIFSSLRPSSSSM